LKVYTYDEVYDATLKYFDNDELSTNVFIEKYLLCNKDGELLEKNPDDMHKRLASEFARIESNYENPMSEDEIYELFKNFKYIVPAGSPLFGVGNPYANTSLSNCVALPKIDDNLSGIFETAKNLANLAKMRCGVGIDLSNLRPDGSSVNNAAKTSSGAWSFAKLFSDTVNMVAQKGRRGALLESLDINHPDIEKFITCKQDKSKITGANISIKVDDAFMQAVENDSDYELSWNGKAKRLVKAKNLFGLIAKTACSSGEPGFLLWDEMKRRLPLNDYPGWEIITTNACGEIPISANFEANIIDSCRLISINGTSFVKNPFTEHAEFDYDSFFPVLRSAIRLADDLVDLEIEKLQKMSDGSDEAEMKKLYSALINAGVQGRRIGVGINGLADLLIKMNLRYGSEEAILFISGLYKKYLRCAYHESCVLAKERGPFPIFDWNVEKENSFICDLDEDIQEMIKNNGRRNGALLTQPPCGTLSILMKSSSGIEPIFQLSYIRRKKISQEDKEKPDFIDEQGINWKEYTIHHPLIEEWEKVTGKSRSEIPKDIFVVANDIKPIDRIKMQSAIQKHLDMSISSTINLPKGTTPKDIEEIYMSAWKHKLKGITVYVDGSRSGVLISDERNGKFKYNSAPKRPVILDCDIHSTSIDGKQHIIIIGLVDKKPYEIFAGEQTKIKIPRRYIRGKIIKNAYKSIRSTYDLSVGQDDDELVVIDIVEQFENPNHLSLCRMISLSMRHGTSPKYIVEQLSKNKSADFHSFTRGIARVLKQYIKDGESANGMEKECPSCKNGKLIYQTGCISCSCGWTKCG